MSAPFIPGLGINFDPLVDAGAALAAYTINVTESYLSVPRNNLRKIIPNNHDLGR
jgi:hypothetical protein